MHIKILLTGYNFLPFSIYKEVLVELSNKMDSGLDSSNLSLNTYLYPKN